MSKATFSHNRQKNKFDAFLLRLVNVTLVTAQIQPLLAVDTTAVFPLTQICAETEHDFSEKGRVLNDSASRLLTSIETVSQSYHQQHRILINNSYCHTHKNRGQTHKQSKLAKPRPKVLPFIEMDQNCNLSNFEYAKNEDKKKKAKVLQVDLKEIIRPEYRRKVQVATHGVNSQKIESALVQSARIKGDEIYTPRQTNMHFISSEHHIPLLKNRNNAQIISKGLHSKSPKVEGNKHNILSNISSISRNYQTQTDQSFQTDHYIGLLQEKQSQSNSSRKSRSIIEGFVSDRQSYKEPHSQRVKPQNNKIVTKAKHKYDRSSSAEIQEEQPWQCDEQQLEQELKQINARLSHRGYETQRFKTEVQTSYNHPNEVENSSIPRQLNQPNERNAGNRKKQPKTVRLSLTPVKSKSPIRKGDKRQVREISIIQKPIVRMAAANRKQNYKPYKVNCLIESESSDIQETLFQCGKWKKPNRGLITVEIQKFIKQN